MQPDVKYLQTRCEECGMVIKTGQFKGGGNSVGKAVKQGFSDEDLTCFQNSDRTSLVIQWLRLCASTAGGTDLIPGWGTKILWAMWHSQKKKITGNIWIGGEAVEKCANWQTHTKARKHDLTRC